MTFGLAGSGHTGGLPVSASWSQEQHNPENVCNLLDNGDWQQTFR